jgi:hypothetical protein
MISRCGRGRAANGPSRSLRERFSLQEEGNLVPKISRLRFFGEGYTEPLIYEKLRRAHFGHQKTVLVIHISKHRIDLVTWEYQPYTQLRMLRPEWRLSFCRYQRPAS